MEEARNGYGDFDSVQFFDALASFPVHDIIGGGPEFEESVHRSLVSGIDSSESKGEGSEELNSPPITYPSSTLRRRSSSRFIFSDIRTPDTKDLDVGSITISGTSDISDASEQGSSILSVLKEDQARIRERPESPNFIASPNALHPQTELNAERTIETEIAVSHSKQSDECPSNALVSLAGLVIKALGFQISLLISSIFFPFWLVHASYIFVTSPVQTVKRLKDHLQERFSSILSSFSPSLHQRLNGFLSVRKFVLRISWGCLWSIYVFSVLFGILFSAVIMSTITMKKLVEEPIRIEDALSFDYTKPNPDAYVPVMSGRDVHCDLVGEKVEVGKRAIPPDRQLEVGISVLLPESDHNRNLGVFQVQVEFLSATGKVLFALSRPCMLQFKSFPIRYFETFIKSAPILVGYSSESQLVRTRMSGFTEGAEPTVCLRVILARRAEFQPGAGIPEIYAASLTLESKLPFLKSIIWKWRSTLFIWTCIWFFMAELFFVLICCRPFIIPRANRRNESGSRT